MIVSRPSRLQLEAGLIFSARWYSRGPVKSAFAHPQIRPSLVTGGRTESGPAPAGTPCWESRTIRRFQRRWSIVSAARGAKCFPRAWHPVLRRRAKQSPLSKRRNRCFALGQKTTAPSDSDMLGRLVGLIEPCTLVPVPSRCAQRFDGYGGKIVLKENIEPGLMHIM